MSTRPQEQGWQAAEPETVIVDDLNLDAPDETPAVAKAGQRKDPMADRLPKRYTDSGIRQRNRRMKKRQGGTKATGVTIIKSDWDKKIESRQDASEGNIEPWEASDPMQEVLDANPAPGMRRRFLSESRINRAGMRGWKPVIGENGQPAKLGGRMILAEMPETKAKQRSQHYQEIGNAAVREIQDSHEDKVNKLIADAQQAGLTVLRPGELVQSAPTNQLLSPKPPPRNPGAIGYEVRRGQ